MTIQIVGKHMDVGESLTQHIKKGLEHVVENSVGDIDAGHVVVFKDHFEFVIDLTVHISDGLIVHCKGHHPDVYKSFEAAQHKLAARLRRYSSRLKSRRKHTQPISEAFASQYIISADHDDNPSEDTPVVIAEMKQNLREISVSEAVMHMDLNDLTVFVFKNAASGCINVVYKRPDGNIGWIDPK